MILNWTQKQTAIHFGIHKDNYQQWEWNNYITHVKYRKKVNMFLEYNFWDDGSGSLANRVLLYRITRGITMNELAEEIHISCNTIERVEQEKHVCLIILRAKLKITLLTLNEKLIISKYLQFL